MSTLKLRDCDMGEWEVFYKAIIDGVLRRSGSFFWSLSSYAGITRYRRA